MNTPDNVVRLRLAAHAFFGAIPPTKENLWKAYGEILDAMSQELDDDPEQRIKSETGVQSNPNM